MSVFDKIKIPTAVEHKTTFDLSCDHITTMNFMIPKVVYSKEVVPRENTTVKVESLTRMSPLLAPTFMRCKVRSRGFFVPFRTVWHGWDNFITSTASPNGVTNSTVPTITNKMFIDELITLANGYVTVVASPTTYTPPTSPYDFVLLYSSKYYFYKFTSKGRMVYDMLIGLGYKINWDYSYSGSYSALPLLSYYKVICDWYYYNQYTQSNYADALRETIGFSSTLSTSNFTNMMSNVKNFVCQYDNDYYTSAFTRASGPSVGAPTISIPNVEASNSAVSSSNGNSSISGTINQYAIDALQSLSDYMKRHQLAGSQAVDRFASRFGIKLANAKIQKSIYLGTDEVQLQIGDVFNNNGDGTTPLGEYAGKGLGYGNNGVFSINSDEFGYFIVISNVVPRVGYGQGVKRQVMHMSQFDFYTPEFDALGNQAIAMKEISLPWDRNVTNNWLSASSSRTADGVFGYTPRYAEYKFGQDFISGNYIYHSTNVGEDCWLGNRLFRDGVDDTLQSGRLVGDTTAGTSMLIANDAEQYERIFADDLNTNTAGNDHFKTVFHFDVKATLPMSSLFDNYHFENKGKEYLAQLGGSSLHN